MIGTRLGEKDQTRLAPELPPERCHFLGPRDDVPALLRELDALLLTSNSEGCPNVVLEALGVGTPVVSADVGDVSAMLRSGETGFAVVPDDHRGYHGALARILAEPARFRAQVEARQAELDAEFGLGAMVEHTLALWDRVHASSS